MDALPLTGAEIAARCVAIERLKRVADDMAWFVERLRGQPDAPGLAQGPLALAARAGWSLAQVALIQADAGIVTPRIIDGIHRRDPAVETPALRRLALTTLEATERRLCAARPSPCDPELREAMR